MKAVRLDPQRGSSHSGLETATRDMNFSAVESAWIYIIIIICMDPWFEAATVTNQRRGPVRNDSESPLPAFKIGTELDRPKQHKMIGRNIVTSPKTFYRL